MEYRLLRVDEWERLKEIYPDNQVLPSPTVASVAVAEENGKLVGALFMQIAMHMEPLIRTDAEADYRELARTLTDSFPKGVPYFSQIPDDRMKHIAEELGMLNTGNELYAGMRR